MTLTKWIDHPELNRKEQLLMLLHSLRLATREQLALLMGVKPSTIDLYIYELNQGKAVRRKNRTQKAVERSEQKRAIYRQRGQIIESIRYRANTPVAYCLSTRGARIVSKLLGEKVPYRDYSYSQLAHHIGINNILLRILERFTLQELKTRGDWFNTTEASALLKSTWSRILAQAIEHRAITKDAAKLKLEEVPKPDACFSLDGKRVWIEYDNDTERRHKLIKKYQDCIEYMSAFNEPIVWVCSRLNPTRAQYLSQLWHQVKEQHHDAPAMFFFQEGEEVHFLIHYFLH